MQPKEIHRTPLSLKIIWADGREEFVDYIWLRSHCTCAVCRERGPLTVTGMPLKKMTEPKKFDLVGNYALGIFWTDGHHSIFSFDALLNHEANAHLPPVATTGSQVI
jgi:DUF971 family protein